MKVYCFGNEFVEEDSLAVKISGKLNIRGIEFVRLNNPLEIAGITGQLIILDVVSGLSEARLFEDAEQFCSSPKNAHDIDLGFYLKLLREIGKLGKVKIIGIPQKGDEELIEKEVKKILNNLSAAATA